MTEATKLQVRSREVRSKLAGLAGVDELTDEQRGEITSLTKESIDIDSKLTAIDVASGEAEARDVKVTELETRCNVGRVFDAVIEHRAVDGAEAELQSELKLQPNQIPLALFAREEVRAVTPAPSNVGQSQQSIIPGVFPQSAAAFLGVRMPTVGVGEAVFPVLTKNADVRTPAENAAATDTTGSFSADVLSPARLQAAFFYSREDAARFSGMDSALRSNLSAALSDGLDRQILQGTEGLFTGTKLANHAKSAATTFDEYVSQFGFSRVDGTYANGLGDLRIVVGSETFADMGATYRTTDADANALEKLMSLTAGLRVSAHVPAAASSKQNGVIRLGSRDDMTAAIWEGVTLIPDEVTLADKGQIKVTAVMLYAIKILRVGGFYKQETNHS